MDLKKLPNVIKMSVPQSPARNIKISFKNAWFNFKCFKGRELSFKYLNDFRKSNIADDKQKYLQANQFYKNECEKAKKEYYEKIKRRINKTANAKEWWSLAKDIRYKYYCERF